MKLFRKYTRETAVAHKNEEFSKSTMNLLLSLQNRYDLEYIISRVKCRFEWKDQSKERELFFCKEKKGQSSM